MLNLPVFTFRLFAFGIGLLFIYIALFLYENEQGRIQNLLEDFWVRIDERHQTALVRNVSFVRRFGRIVNFSLDTLFGRKLLSVRSIGVSFCYSLASGLLVSTVEYRIIAWYLIAPLFGSLALSVLPNYIKRSITLKIWFGFVVISYLVFILTLRRYANSTWDFDDFSFFLQLYGPLYIGLTIGVACDVFFIALSRKLFRWLSEQTSFGRLGLLISINVLLVFTLFVVPIAINLKEYRPAALAHLLESLHSINSPMLDVALGILKFCAIIAARSNLFIVLVTISHILIAFGLIAHRLFWPFLSRPVYSLQRLGVARRSKLFGFVGSLLIVGAAGGVTWVEKVVDRLIPFG